MTIAAITMTWNDNWFLNRWVNYFGEALGRENLYIIIHGEDLAARETAHGCNIVCVPRNHVEVNFDTDRWSFLSNFATALSSFYSTVITLDVDELLVPSTSDVTLKECLENDTQDCNFCVPGFELFPDAPGLDNYDANQSIATQSKAALFSPFYSKACISKGDVKFTPGGHGLLGGYAALRTEMALLHLRFINTGEANRRRALREKIADTAYKAHGVTVEEMRKTGRLVSWKEAQKRHKAVFRQMKNAKFLNWEDMIAHTSEELPKLQREHNGRFHFRPMSEVPLKTTLPYWMIDRF